LLERGTLLVDMPDIVWGDLSIDTAAIRMYVQQLEAARAPRSGGVHAT
jgi:hypothetical protein